MTAAVDVSGLADVCLPSAQKTTQQLGMLSWMGRAAQCAVRWSAVLPGNREPLQLEPEYIPIITKKLTAAVVFLRVVSTLPS